MLGLHSQLRVILALRNCLPWSTELYKSAERGQPKPLLHTHTQGPAMFTSMLYTPLLQQESREVKEKVGHDQKSARGIQKRRGWSVRSRSYTCPCGVGDMTNYMSVTYYAVCSTRRVYEKSCQEDRKRAMHS